MIEGHPVNILIVDDEPKNLTVLETVLDDPGYKLIRATSADEALLKLVAEEFALLILDIRMPGMNGFELAQTIKERTKTAEVPIIFLTAYYNEDQHVLEGYDAGAVDFLHKPINARVLRSKVAVFVELHRRQREVVLANHALRAEISQRRRVEAELRELNDTLEHRVATRTSALQASEEQLRDADRKKDEFLATLAHELRNPLAPVRTAVQLLQVNGSTSPQFVWARDVIGRQTEHMSRLIDDLMDVGRINRGRLELKLEHLELAKVIQGAVETSRPLIEESGHALTVTLPSNPVIVDADLTRLAQVFLNLLNNAAKYTENGGRIDLRAVQQGSDVVVSVRDTGIGIPPAKLPTIFELFSQVEGALSRSQGGLGIGLCLVKRLVEMHGGRVEAHSEGPGMGSEFVVRLPIVIDKKPAREANVEDKAIPTSALRILVVDDNRDAASTLTMLLELMGNNVRAAHDGLEAVDVAAAFRPHVVLCDIGLPKLNGYEACRRMKAQAWDKNMILIAVTGWGQADAKRQSEEAGFDHHMVKPVDPRALMDLLAGMGQVKA